jgi:hypothetical protein
MHKPNGEAHHIWAEALDLAFQLSYQVLCE